MRGLAVVLVCGCYHPNAGQDVPCAANFECPSGQTCDRTRDPPLCTAIADAGGTRDGHPDATHPDGPAPDGPAVVPIVLVQQASDKPVGTSQALAFPAPIADHDTLILCLNFNSSNSVDLVSIDDTLHNNYSLAVNGVLTGTTIHYVAVALDSPPGADTVTVTFTAAVPMGGSDLMMLEYSGLAAVNAFDVANNASGTALAMDSGNVATHSAHELVLGYAEGNVQMPGTGFTQRAIQSNNIVEDEVVFTTGTYSATATARNTTTTWTMIVATFRGQ